jgi:hypothetical protein
MTQRMFLAILLYLTGLCVTYYDKYCVMLDPWEKPGLYHSPVLFPSFFIAKLALYLTSYFLVYRAAGLFVAFGAVAVQFILGSVLLRIFFRKRVAIWYPHCAKAVREEKREAQAPLSDAEIESRAMMLAEGAARKAMRDEF